MASPRADLRVLAGRTDVVARVVPAVKRPGAGGQRRAMNPMQFDKNRDGKLTKDELPEQMQAFFDRMDANSDGVVDSAELAELRRRMGGAGGPGGPGGPDGPGGQGGGGGVPDHLSNWLTPHKVSTTILLAHAGIATCSDASF